MKSFEEVVAELSAVPKDQLALDGAIAKDVKDLLEKLRADPMTKRTIDKLTTSYAAIVVLGGADPIEMMETIIRSAIVYGYEIAKRMYQEEMPK